jgi:uncharacterized membrane protein
MADEYIVDMPDRSVVNVSDAPQKTLARWLYIGHALSLLFSLGLFSFIPLIINYVKRNDAAGTFVASHHSWQIRSFWWYAVWIVLGMVAFFTIFLIPLAWAIWTASWVWKAYRLIKGLIWLNENKAMPG